MEAMMSKRAMWLMSAWMLLSSGPAFPQGSQVKVLRAGGGDTVTSTTLTMSARDATTPTLYLASPSEFVYHGVELMSPGFSGLLGYDNTTSTLSATNVQGAIDELAVSGGGGDAFNEIDVPGGTNPVASGQSTLTLAEGAGIAITGDAATDTVTIASTVVVPVGANPTAVVDGTAVNGSAATFMRSDAAPALANPFTPDGDQVIHGNLVLGEVGNPAGIAIKGSGKLSFGDHVGAFPHISREGGSGETITLNFAGSPGGELVLSNLDGSGSYTGIYALAGINSIGQLRIYGESAPGSIYGKPFAKSFLIRNASTVGSGEGASVIIDANGATGEIVFGTNGSRAAIIDGAQNVLLEQDLTVNGDTYLGSSAADTVTIAGNASTKSIYATDSYWMPVSPAAVASAWAYDFTNYRYRTTTNPAKIICPLYLTPGTVIEQVRTKYQNFGNSGISVSLKYQDAAGQGIGATTVWTVSLFSSSVPMNITTNIADHTIMDGRYYWIEIASFATGGPPYTHDWYTTQLQIKNRRL